MVSETRFSWRLLRPAIAEYGDVGHPFIAPQPRRRSRCVTGHAALLDETPPAARRQGDGLVMLIEGATLLAQLGQGDEAIAAAKSAALQLLSPPSPHDPSRHRLGAFRCPSPCNMERLPPRRWRRHQTVTLMSVASTVLAIPFVIALPLARPGGVAVHSGVGCPADGLFPVSSSPPIATRARAGLSDRARNRPVLVTLSAVIFAAQRATPHEVLGVLLIAGGSQSRFRSGQNPGTKSRPMLSAPGRSSPLMQQSNSLGIRMADGSNAYTAWVLVGYGILLPLAYTIARARLHLDVRAPQTGRPSRGASSRSSPMRLSSRHSPAGPAGPIAALRETSVLFATLIGWAFLGEKLSLLRVLASATVAVGSHLPIQ